MAVVPTRLSKEQVRKINLLVRLGVYANRSEAIKSMLERDMDLEIQRYLVNPKVEQVVKAMLLYRNEQDVFKLTAKKSAVELVAEGRI